MASTDATACQASVSSPGAPGQADGFQKDRTRRRPFATWVKKLTNFKGGDSNILSGRRQSQRPKSHLKKNQVPHNPYPESGYISNTWPANRHRSFSTVPTGPSTSRSSVNYCGRSMRSSLEGIPPTIGTKSIAATMSTEPDTARSDVAPSHGTSSGEGTVTTNGAGVGRGEDSTFSSPAPSVRSMTTTLTTIQSTTLGTNGQAGGQQGNTPAHRHDNHSIHFVHQFPSSPPASAIPAHLAPQTSGGHPTTYNMMIANNQLSDNASILTLASSTKRRRRRSFDTDASVRAMAPSSLFGGSRESLPLSILSSNVESNPVPTPSLHQPRQLASERASIYSATGVAPALPSERNSYYAGKQSIVGDGGSVKSGFLGHARNDSVSGNIGGIGVSSPLTSTKEAPEQSSQSSAKDDADGEKGDVPDTNPDASDA